MSQKNNCGRPRTIGYRDVTGRMRVTTTSHPGCDARLPKPLGRSQNRWFVTLEVPSYVGQDISFGERSRTISTMGKTRHRRKSIPLLVTWQYCACEWVPATTPWLSPVWPCQTWCSSICTTNYWRAFDTSVPMRTEPIVSSRLPGVPQNGAHNRENIFQTYWPRLLIS